MLSGTAMMILGCLKIINYSSQCINSGKIWSDVHLSTNARWQTIIKSNGIKQQAFILFTHLWANWSSAAPSSGWGLDLGLLEYSFQGLGQRGNGFPAEVFSHVKEKECQRASPITQAQFQPLLVSSILPPYWSKQVTWSDPTSMGYGNIFLPRKGQEWLFS